MSNITAHMIVRNEEQWVWYAITSVINYVEKVIIFDTGSEDRTPDIVRYFSTKKVVFKNKGKVIAEQLTHLRNEQIRETRTEWFMLLDGDEVWPTAAISEFKKTIEGVNKNIIGIVVPTIVPVGDLFHYQPENAGKYHLLGRVGHMNLRAYRKRNGYLWKGVYPLEAYVDQRDIPIQNKSENLVRIKNNYWHMTHLERSSKESHNRKKFEIGERRNLRLPEVFFETRPSIVPSPWVYFSIHERFKAHLKTPLLKIRRKLKK